MKEINKSYLEIKKSKFYGYLYNIESIDEVNEILNNIKINNKKAKHIVYAYKLDNLIRNYPDKEPNATTRGLIDTINMKELNNTLIVVVRYFGGTLLGSGPLTRAYTKVSFDLINKNSSI